MSSLKEHFQKAKDFVAEHEEVIEAVALTVALVVVFVVLASC